MCRTYVLYLLYIIIGTVVIVLLCYTTHYILNMIHMYTYIQQYGIIHARSIPLYVSRSVGPRYKSSAQRIFFNYIFNYQRDSVAWPYMNTHTLGSCNNMYILKWDYVNKNMLNLLPILWMQNIFYKMILR